MQTEDGPAPGGRVSRRDLLKRAGLLGVAAAVPVGTLAPEAVAVAEREQLQALTATEAETLEAILERLIPADASGPGAKEAKVLRYVDWSLAGPLKIFRDVYAIGLAAVDAYAQATYGAPFASLGAEQQDAVLTAMDKNTATGFTPNAKAVFETFRTHAVQGMFGDPYHGGNAGFAGWDLVGFQGIRLVYTQKQQALDYVPRKNNKSTADYPNFGLKKTKGA